MTRHTSNRRRGALSGNRARRYRGDPGTAKAVEAGPLAVSADTEGAVRCESCGFHVLALKTGQPRAHSPGGFGLSVQRGRFACPGSGAEALRTYVDDIE